MIIFFRKLLVHQVSSLINSFGDLQGKLIYLEWFVLPFKNAFDGQKKMVVMKCNLQNNIKQKLYKHPGRIM